MTPRTAAVALALVWLVVPSVARSQRIVGTGDDTDMPLPGTVRLRVSTEWTRFDQRYASGLGGRSRGALEPLGAAFALDTLGVRQLPQLAATQSRIRSLANAPSFSLSLGNSVANLDASVVRTPIHVEVGVTPRLALGLMVPYVRTRTVARVQINPDGTRASVGLNPLLSADLRSQAQGQNQTLYQQFASAADSLARLTAACRANPGGSPGCGPVLADLGGADALVAESNAFSGNLQAVYGGSGTTFSPVVPLTRSPTQNAINAQIDAFDQRYQRYLGASPRIVGRPFAALGPFALADADLLVTDATSVAGIRGDPLGTVEQSHVGDVEVGAKVLLVDAPSVAKSSRPWWRSTLSGVLRFPTGERPAPDNFIGVRTDEGTGAVELRSANDLAFGSRLSLGLNGRYAWARADEETARIPETPSSILVGLPRRQRVRRQMGSVYELELSPRYMVTPSLRVAGFFLLRERAADRYTGRFASAAGGGGLPGGAALDASTLGAGTDATEQRLGGGFTYSSSALYARGRSRLPLDASFLHYETVHASGGNTAKVTTDQVSLRLYLRLLGAGR